MNSSRAHYSITSSARARSIGRIESDTARPAAGREGVEENWATTDGIKHPALSLWRGGVCKSGSAEFEARGQKSNDEIMERMNALYGPNGFRREYGLCRKCIVAGAVAASPIDDDALVRAIPADLARGAEAEIGRAHV